MRYRTLNGVRSVRHELADLRIEARDIVREWLEGENSGRYQLRQNSRFPFDLRCTDTDKFPMMDQWRRLDEYSLIREYKKRYDELFWNIPRSLLPTYGRLPALRDHLSLIGRSIASVSNSCLTIVSHLWNVSLLSTLKYNPALAYPGLGLVLMWNQCRLGCSRIEDHRGASAEADPIDEAS